MTRRAQQTELKGAIAGVAATRMAKHSKKIGRRRCDFFVECVEKEALSVPGSAGVVEQCRGSIIAA